MFAHPNGRCLMRQDTGMARQRAEHARRVPSACRATRGYATPAPWPWSRSGATPTAPRSSSGSAARSRSRARALQGRTSEAWRILRAEEARSAPTGPPVSEHSRRPTEFAVAYVALGAYDQALDWLEREVESGSNMTMGLKADTRLAPLRGHARYHGLLRRLGVS